MSQEQFLEVIDRDEAQRRFHAALRMERLEGETVAVDEALGRVLADDVIAAVDVPSFDRSNFDGYAVQAADTFGASEEAPRKIELVTGEIATGVLPQVEVAAGRAIGIATGGMLPRGADAIVMVEHCDEATSPAGERVLVVQKSVAPGFGVSFAGTDIAAGETVLYQGTPFTSRETGVLAAIGLAQVRVVRRPRVAILSTGDEIIAPGEPMRPPLVYDSNARVLADAVRELGGEPQMWGITPDDAALLRTRLHVALAAADVVLLSGGTSKGAGDVSYRVVGELREPGIVAHGVALKPGKPICLAVTQNKPVVVLPGFPTSAIFTFHEFVAPVLRRLGGWPAKRQNTIAAELAVKVNSEIGRTEYLLVGLVESDAMTERRRDGAKEGKRDGERNDAGSVQSSSPFLSVPPSLLPSISTSHVAFPMGKGSGSVTTFALADGFITIGRHEEIVAAGTPVEVTLLGRDLQPADLVVIGSHCVGLDLLLSLVNRGGFRPRFLAVGSTAGLDAARRGECDIAGIHLLDEATGEYNRPFATGQLELVRGYGRMQGVVFRRGDPRFAGQTAAAAIDRVQHDLACLMINRNAGSGTRILSDKLLAGARPAGYAVHAKSHNAVAAAVAQGRADWGVAIQSAAARAGLGFLPLAEEQFDFVVPQSRRDRPAVHTFIELLHDAAVRRSLCELGLLLN